MKRMATIVVGGAVAMFLTILVVHNFSATKPIAEVIGAPGAWFGLLFVRDGHDFAQVVAVVIGEFAWCLVLAFGSALAIRRLMRMF